MKQTLFAKQIKANPKAHELSVALGMVGLNVSIQGAELIMEAQETMRKMGGKFDVKTAVRILLATNEKYSKMQSDFEDEK